MSFLKPDPPSPPNPLDTARAQTGTNVSTSVANAYLGNINQVTPSGSLTYSNSGNYSWTDPATGQTYSIPTFTATQSIRQIDQMTQDASKLAQYRMANMASDQAAKVAGLLGNNMDLSGAPQAGSAQNIANVPTAATSFDNSTPVLGGIGPAGDITNTYGPADNFSADRQRVEDSLMARMNPQLQIEKQGLQQQLADQGIRYGSQAYSDAMMNYSRQADDARWGAIQNAGQEQQRMNTEAAQLAAFQNQAQQQGYEQTLGRGQFYNQAQAQQYNQAAQMAQFGNLGLAQQVQQQQAAFNAAQAARNQYMQEQYAQRNQPLNEITALLSGSQVQQPNFVNTPGAQIPTTDIAGLVNQGFQQQFQNYAQQSQNVNSTLGGILGAGAGALRGGMISDVRAKENITPMGTVFSTDVDHDDKRTELPIYQYSYKADPSSTTHIGPMAQDVEKIDKGAVKSVGGVKHIDPRRVMGGILRAA